MSDEYAVLAAYAAELGLEMGENDEDADEVWYAAIEEELLPVPLGEDAVRYLDRPESYDPQRMVFAPIDELDRLVGEAGGKLVIKGRVISRAELRTFVAVMGLDWVLDMLWLRPPGEFELAMMRVDAKYDRQLAAATVKEVEESLKPAFTLPASSRGLVMR